MHWGCVLLVVSLLLCSGDAFKVILGPGKTECISEPIDAEHFEVPGGARVEGAIFVNSFHSHGSPSITIRVLSPHGDQLWQQQHVTDETHFNIAARGPGVYKVCFFNPWETRSEAVVDLVYFTLAHLRRPGGTVNVPKGTQETRSKEVAQKEHLDEVKRTILSMSELVAVVQGEQRYLHRKLDRHTTTVKSNNWRTWFYSSLEVLALLVASAVQIITIRQFFKGATPKLSV